MRTLQQSSWVCAAILFALGASAQDKLAAPVKLNIESQPLMVALEQFANQTGLQIVFRDENPALDGFRTPRIVSDRFSPAEALGKMLATTGLTYEFVNERTVRIAPARTPAQTTSLLREDKQTTVMTLAQHMASEAVPDQNTATAAGSDGDKPSEVIVTGTRIRGAGPVGANVLTLDRQAIEDSGRSTVQDVLATVTQNFSGGTNEVTQQSGPEHNANRSFASSINLRGLGNGSTLSLINGRRLAPAGVGHFVDVSTIPLAAVERVEVLADGASATYGSDAVGGVVNMILRDDYEGSESSVRFGADGRGDLSEQQFSQVAGWRWDRGNLVAAFEYRHRTPLEWDDRAFSSNSDLRRYGGLDYSRVQANPGTITRIGTTNVTLAIPTGQNGTALAASSLIAGLVNRQNAVEGQSMLPEQDLYGLFLSGRFELTPRLTLFADALAGRREAEARRVQTSTTIIIPESNYYRQLNGLFPGQGNIRMSYWFGDDLGPARSESESRAITAAYGFEYNVGGDWRIELAGTHAASKEFIHQAGFYDPSSPAVAAALASSSVATAFNPFADGSNTPQSVLAGFTSITDTQTDARVSGAALKADGPLFNLWGGPLRAALGYERRNERFIIDRVDYRYSGITRSDFQPPQSRRVDAAFVELNAPLARVLTLSLSARYEDAEDYGDATVPRIGLTWDAIPDLRLRAAWGKSFRGPTFDQLDAGGINSFAVVTTVQDPLADDGTTGVMLSSGGGDNLRPERAETWSAGFDLHPRWLEGLSFSATYFDIAYTDRIDDGGATPLAMLFNSLGYESRIIRDPTPAQIAYYLALPFETNGAPPAEGIEVIIDTRLRNLAAWNVRGVDLAADFHFNTGLGTFGLFANATHLIEHTRRATASSVTISNLNTTLNPLDWRARAGMSWRREDWSANLGVNYQNKYRDAYVAGGTIPSYVTWDLRLARQVRWDKIGGETRLSLSVQNLFDKDPPFANNPIGFGFDPANASPIGRFAALELRHVW